MAPRRPKKVGMRRIDAAIDALTPLGFEKETICQTIKNLLKVYDDDAAWCLLEECSYKLVIETILGDNEQKEREEGKAWQEARASKKIVDADEPVDWKDHSRSDMGHGMEKDVTNRGQLMLAAPDDEPQPDSELARQQYKPLLVNSPRAKGFPCYGWISNSDEENKPEIGLEAQSLQPGRRRKRPTRWDVKPSDL